MVTLAQRVEALRMEKKMTRAEFAAAIGLPRTSIEKIETGRLTPNKEQQEKLASFFGVSMLYLKGETDDPTDMSGWLNGNIHEEPDSTPAPAPVKRPAERKIVAQTENASAGSAMFNSLLKSDAFRAAVIEVLRTPEGEKLLRQIIRKEMK